LFKGKQTSERLSMAVSEAASAQHSLKALRDKVDRQAILLESLWTLLKSKLECSDDDLQAIMEDLESKADGAVAPACPNCNRPLQENSPVCVYCGEKHDIKSLF
jgi:hypothetical protein